MGIFEKREAYKPFEYPEVTKFTDAMSKSYWVHSEVEFTADVQDYKSNLTDVEREALKRSLLGIAQIEVAVKTFWGDLYKLFPKPEFNNLGMSFGESEVRHSEAYSRLLEVLGYVKEFENILDIPVFKKRYHVLKDYLNENKDNIMEKLLFFTLVVENASLFSQFATILYFSRFKGYMKNVANMIAWSSTDEACLKLNTEVLTPQGWRFIKDMKVGDDIYGFKEGVLRNEKVLKTIRKPFKGSFYIIHNHGGHKCLSMTPDHEVIYKRDGLWDKVYTCNFRPAIGTWLPTGVDYENPSENTKKFTDLDFLKFIMSTAGKKVGIDARTIQYKYEVTPCDSLSSEVIERVLKSLKISYEKTIFIPDEVEQIRLK